MSLFQAGNPTAMTPTAKNNQNTGLLSTTAASGEKMYAKIQGLNVPTDPRNMLQSMTQPINMQTNINTATAATAATAGTTSNPSVNLFNPSANQFNPSTNQLIPSANPYPPTISFDPNSPHPPLNPPSNPPPTINL